MGSALTIVNLTDVPDMLKQFIRATPALIVVNDDLQGENLLADGVDGKLIATAIVAKRMEEEDLAIHQQETHRLDNLINAEKTKAIDDYTLSLINGGII
jgi:hypothetical protein